MAESELKPLHGISPAVSSQQNWRFIAFQTAPASLQMERDFLTIAGTLAAKASHPAAPAIELIAQKNGHPHCPVIGFQDFPEKGFGGAVQLPGEESPRAVLVGNRSFLAEAGLDMPAILEVAARQWESEGALVLMGGWDGYVRGIMKFQP